MRQVEIAIGLTDQTWYPVTVGISEDPDHVLDDDDLKEAAMLFAQRLKKRAGSEAAFFHILYIKPVTDPLNGLV